MLQNVLSLLRTYPELVVFLALAGGYFIGKIKIFKFNIGSTAGVLIVALILGQINVQIHPLIKAVSFALFIFCIGYRVGPEFFGAIKKEGVKYILLTLVVAIVALFTAIMLGKFFHFDPGTAAGMLGGAMTQSSVIGTADGAIKHLAISAANKTTYESNVAIAYAITYIFGTVGLILFFKLMPRLLRIDLKEEAKQLELRMSGGDDTKSPELFTWHKRLNLRVYKVLNEKVIGKTVGELEAFFPEQVSIDRIKRNNQLMIPDDQTTIQTNDIVSVIGVRDELLEANKILGPEVYDDAILNMDGEILEICVLSSCVAGKTLGQLSREFGHACYLKKITRQGHQIPITENT